jgi:hypothetical protein
MTRTPGERGFTGASKPAAWSLSAPLPQWLSPGRAVRSLRCLDLETQMTRQEEKACDVLQSPSQLSS